MNESDVFVLVWLLVAMFLMLAVGMAWRLLDEIGQVLVPMAVLVWPIALAAALIMLALWLPLWTGQSLSRHFWPAQKQGTDLDQ